MGDQGCCCIDEFDKMSAAEHQALLEAMEQQTISVAKAGIVCSLSARTAVLAAAGPVGGHYDQRKTVSENLKLPSNILSRFDLIFVLLRRPKCTWTSSSRRMGRGRGARPRAAARAAAIASGSAAGRSRWAAAHDQWRREGQGGDSAIEKTAWPLPSPQPSPRSCGAYRPCAAACPAEAERCGALGVHLYIRAAVAPGRRLGAAAAHMRSLLIRIAAARARLELRVGARRGAPPRSRWSKPLANVTRGTGR